MKNIFQIGDKVCIIAPFGEYQGPSGVYHHPVMDRFTGITTTITQVWRAANGWTYTVRATSSWTFAEEWLEFAEPNTNDKLRHVEDIL